MKGLLGFMGATLGGAVGWYAGALVGTMTAFFVSIIGTAAGVYFAQRFRTHWLS